MALSEEQRRKLLLAFRPHSPIEDPAAFQGRQDERNRVSEALALNGLQVIIYGERGAGKTSLANVATAGLARIQVFCERDFTFPALARAILTQWQKLEGGPPADRIIFDAAAGLVRKAGNAFPMDRLTGNDLRTLLPTDRRLIVVLDELDRIKDPKVHEAVAELCKNLSTYQQNISLVMVGVANTADALLRGHSSNIRNLRQVSLGRMSQEDLRKILEHGEQVLNLKFDPIVQQLILKTCDQLPYYLHLLAMNAASACLERGANAVQKADYDAGLIAAAKDCDEELGRAYDTAILSTHNSAIYRRIIWSLSDSDDRAETPSNIKDRVNALAHTEGEAAVSVQSVGAAIRRLMGSEKHTILTQSTAGFYQFTNPLMRGYVRLIRQTR